MKKSILAPIILLWISLIASPPMSKADEEGIPLEIKNPPSSYRPFTLVTSDNYLTNLVFTNEERQLLQLAEDAINDTIESDELIERFCNSPAYLTGKAHQMIDYQLCLPEEYRLGDQSVILSQTISIAMFSRVFGSRTVSVGLYDQSDNTLGKALVGIVDLGIECSLTEGFRINANPGKFEIWINRHNLPGTTPEELAGTILHEIYHNLGHSHPQGGQDRDWQIYTLTDHLGQRWIRHSCFRQGNTMKMTIPTN